MVAIKELHKKTNATDKDQADKIDSLIQKIAKQDATNKALQSQIDELTKSISQCCSNGSKTNSSLNTAIFTQNIELSNAIVLNQNVPNPFAEQTVISYSVPQNFNSAQILFYDASGKLIKTVDVKTTGKGVLNVFANDLTSGIYSYTLVIDGKIIDTKKMMKQD